MTSGDLVVHASELTGQHLAYWGVLAVLALWAAGTPLRQRRHCLD
ncbi:hypothetical protein [Nonomuraea salmonea]